MNNGLTPKQTQSIKNVLLLNSSINTAFNEFLDTLDGIEQKETEYYKNEIEKYVANIQNEIKSSFNITLFDCI